MEACGDESHSFERIKVVTQELNSCGKEEKQMDSRKVDDEKKIDTQKVATQLDHAQIQRYSRQLLVEDFGVQGQLKLCSSKVLLIGAGGLGSSIALYLSGGGVGKLGIVDFDLVERSNLHRQIIHLDENIGMAKAESAKLAINKLNPLVCCTAYVQRLDHTNALELIEQYDVVVDASDNMETRYLVNDACVLTKRPLVSGSALGLEGHVSVYNWKGGPCYRCCYPEMLSPSMLGNCSDNGVLGVVPGIIGCLQAMETIKIISGLGEVLSEKQCVYDAWDGTFRNYKIQGRNPECLICSDNAKIHTLLDTQKYWENRCTSRDRDSCNTSKDVWLKDCNILSVKEFDDLQKKNNNSVVVIDVREKVQFEICSLPDSINIPLRHLQTKMKSIRDLIDGKIGSRIVVMGLGMFTG